MSASGQRRINIGMTRARLELVDEVAAMLALIHGGRAPGRPETIERVFEIIRVQLRTALAQQERRNQTR